MHKNNKRRGRPSKNRPNIDLGTKELQAKRKAAAYENPALAESLLGVLYAHQLISQPLYEAGRFFGELGYRFEPCLEQKFRPSSSVLTHLSRYGNSPLEWSDHQMEKRTRAWYTSLKALKQAGDVPCRTVLRVVFYEQDLYTMPILKAVMPFLKPLQEGLEVLDGYFRGRVTMVPLIANGTIHSR